MKSPVSRRVGRVIPNRFLLFAEDRGAESAAFRVIRVLCAWYEDEVSTGRIYISRSGEEREMGRGRGTGESGGKIEENEEDIESEGLTVSCVSSGSERKRRSRSRK